MDKSALIKKLKELAVFSEEDAEVAHIKADELLIQYIGDTGIKRAFNKIEKWYA